MKHEGHSGTGLFVAFFGGALAGAALAALLTPMSGRDARRRMKDLAKTTVGGATRIPEALAEGTHAARATLAGKNAIGEAH